VFNSPANPAHGGTYLVTYLTGAGALDRALASGAFAPLDVLIRPRAPVAATIAGKPATVQFAGLAPGFVGLVQVNLLVPDGLSGEQPLVVTVGNTPSNSALVSVAP